MKRSHFFLPILTVTALAFAPLGIHAREVEATATPTANLELARQLNQAFVQVAEQVSPCVVVITVTQKPSTNPHGDDGMDDEQNPWEQFRRFFKQYDPDQQQQQQAPQKATGQGSGIIIRKNGYILTNRHVVEDAEKIEVRLKDGRTYNAEIRGVDAPADVAVIKIDANDLPVAKLADSSKTRVGEFAIAIGAPFALDYSVTFGHVSAKDRSNILDEQDNQNTMTDQNFIQTDANINPGNSGGPLVNIEGEVIGINTLIRGLHTGIGFAIPINLAREIADKLITDGKFARSWLGVKITSLREYPEFRPFAKGVQDGVVVREITPSGPAAKSKLRPADIITAVDGSSVVTSQQLKDIIRTKKAGQEVTLDVFRRTREDDRWSMKPLKIVVRPDEWVNQNDATNAEEAVAQETPESHNPLGLSAKVLTPDLAKKYNVDMAKGVIVTSVDKSSIAAQSGIQEGDIITSIDDVSISTSKQFVDAMKKVNTKNGVIVHLISDGAARFELLREDNE